MGCILRISGPTLDIDQLQSNCELLVHRFWKKDEVRSVTAKPNLTSGASFVVSDAGLDEFAQQLIDATAYIQDNMLEITRLCDSAGVDLAFVDFGVAIYEDSVDVCSHLPATFVKLAATAGLGIEVSYYACSHEDAESSEA